LDIVRIMRDTVHKDRLIEKGDRVLVAVSGGPDSVGLLRLLLDVQHELGIHLGVVHVDHGLRSQESRRDADFVRRLAARWALPCHSFKRDVPTFQKAHKLSLEEAARILRYECFRTAAADHHYNKVALGHQQDDNAELVLMRLLRGSGPLGLSAMATFRASEGACPPIIRPLLPIPRDDILHYLNAKQQDYVQDATNRDNRYLRNRIRNELLPMLKVDYNPNLVAVLTRSAAVLGAEEDWFAPRIDTLLAKASRTAESGYLELDLKTVRTQHPAILRRLLRRAIRQVKGDLRRIAFDHVEAAMQLALSNGAPKTLDLPGRLRIGCDHERYWIKMEERDLRLLGREQKQMRQSDLTNRFSYAVACPARTSPISIVLEKIGKRLTFTQLTRHAVGPFSDYGHQTAFFDMNTLTFPLEIRCRRPGDRFRPLGLGGEQTVGKFLSESNVPFREREGYPLVLSQDQVIWVVGQRIDDRNRLTDATKMVLKAEVFLA
jgi:tRNA(Ile)-lysidine synthase